MSIPEKVLPVPLFHALPKADQTFFGDISPTRFCQNKCEIDYNLLRRGEVMELWLESTSMHVSQCACMKVFMCEASRTSLCVIARVRACVCT